jgi:flagellar motor switch protein FliG
LALLALGFVVLTGLRAEPSLDSERLDLETRMQSRVENALGKILPSGQFVVVVRVEPLNNKPAGAVENNKDDQQFYLPGVPVRRSYDGSGDQLQNLADTIKSEKNTTFQRFIRRIQVTLVLDQTLGDETVSKVRDLTRQLLSLDAERGDTLDIQRTVFNKPVIETPAIPTGILLFQKEVRSYWLLIALVLVLIVVGVFVLFVFGPLRGFLNNFVQILPTLKTEGGGGRISLEVPPMMPMMNSGFGLPGGGGPGGNASFSGSLQVDNPNKNVLPFGFIREDHLSNLAILLARETPEKAAVVLGYLPSDWISKVLARLEPAMQTDVAASLATTRQLLPEQVEDIEQDLKRRLDYLIGGPERIFSLYESLDPEAQKRMMDSLKASRPEIVEQLRKKTLLFEDLDRFEAASLRSILREVDLQTIVSALRGMSDGFKTHILEHMSQGKAEIVRQELELSDGSVGKGTAEAQRKVVTIAKRLEREGQIHVPTVEAESPASRYGPSLRSTLKLPPGLRRGDVIAAETASNDDIKDRIKRFMDRPTEEGKERYPTEPPQ